MIPDRSDPHRVVLRVPRVDHTPLAAVARRIGSAVGLVLFVAIVTRLNAGGFVDSTDGSLSFLDALYYASVTVTTTGYGDISAVSDTARLATIFLITPARIVFLILVVGTTVEVLTDQSRELLAARRWRRKLDNHIVVCGFGSTGQSAVRELLNRGVAPDELIVVDTTVESAETALRWGLAAVSGDATHRSVLHEAAVERARAVIVTPNRDDTAVLITLTVRELNEGAHLVAAGREQDNLHLLRQGGADEVIDATAALGRMIGLAAEVPGAVAVVNDILDTGTGLGLEESAPIHGDGGYEVPAHTTVVAVLRDDVRLTLEQAIPLRRDDRLILLVEED